MAGTTTSPEEAMAMIRELDMASTKTDSQSKTSYRRLERAATKLFIALTGIRPTPEQVKEMVSW